MLLATEEKALLAFEPTRRIVPTTKTKINGEHHRILGNVLASIVCPELGEDTHLPAIPFNRENSDFRLEMPTPRKTERGWIRH